MAERATAETVDDMVDAWHDGDSGLPLWEYLGWTEAEYSRWVETSKAPEEADADVEWRAIRHGSPVVGPTLDEAYARRVCRPTLSPGTPRATLQRRVVGPWEDVDADA